MPTPWTVQCVTAVEGALLANPVLASYVDRVVLWGRHREKDVPDFERHAIAMILGGVNVTPDAAGANEETFDITLKSFIKVWDASEAGERALLIGTNVIGVGTSEVGILPMQEHISNALRLQEFIDEDGYPLVAATGLEADGLTDLSPVPNDARDRLVFEGTQRWTGLRKAYHDEALR